MSENCAYCVIHSYETHVHWNWRVFITVIEQHSFQTQLRRIDNWEQSDRSVLLVKGCSEEVQIINYTKLPPKKWKKALCRVQNEDFLCGFKIAIYTMQKLIFGAPRTGNYELTMQIQRLSIYMQNTAAIKLIFKSALEWWSHVQSHKLRFSPFDHFLTNYISILTRISSCSLHYD